jgi:hypothetical protein
MTTQERSRKLLRKYLARGLRLLDVEDQLQDQILGGYQVPTNDDMISLKEETKNILEEENKFEKPSFVDHLQEMIFDLSLLNIGEQKAKLVDANWLDGMLACLRQSFAGTLFEPFSGGEARVFNP